MRPVERLGMFRGSTGRAAYLVGWTKPLRRARGVRGEVGGGNRTQHSESRHPAGVLGGVSVFRGGGRRAGERALGAWGGGGDESGQRPCATVPALGRRGG